MSIFQIGLSYLPDVYFILSLIWDSQSQLIKFAVHSELKKQLKFV